MTNYPDESSLRFNGFFFFKSRWNVLHLFRRKHYWLFFTADGYFLFWICCRLNRHFYFSLWLRSCRGLGLGCGSGGTSLPLFAFLLNSFRITPLDYVSHYLLRNLEVTIQFEYGLRGQDHIDKHVIAVTMMLNRVCQAAAPPLIYFDDLTVIVFDDLLNAL